MIINEDPKVLAKKILKYEEIIRKSGEYEKKIEDELVLVKKQLKNKAENEELMRLEILKGKRNYNSLKASYQKLNDEYLTIVDQLREKKSKKKQLSLSFANLEIKLSDEILSNSKYYTGSTVAALNQEILKYKKTLDEKEWITEQNIKNLHMMKEELAEQLKITKASEFSFKRSLEKLQADFLEKEKVLKAYDDRYKLAEDSLTLFYTTVKYKEDQINSEKL